MSNRTPPFIALLALLILPLGPALAAEDAAQVEFFEAKVRPILADRCIGCHGPDKQKGGLRLDSADALRNGGDSGPPVLAGNPEESLLIQAIRQEGGLAMPPKTKLKEAEVATLVDWVKRGAHWPATPREARPAADAAAVTRPITDEDRAFWAFRLVADPPPPAVADAAWPQGPVDRFVLAALEARGLRPSPPADKRTLIRRVTFDLTGLPPTPAEVDAFLADDAPDAFARLVERLLASPAYGERWARHWLDVARYGEDQAHSFQPRLYPNGFRYRDWLVNAFNADLPYDQFLAAQIAGDLLDEPGRAERLPALGFFACGPVYYGDPKKLDQIDDRIDTLTRGVLGLTVACARCHDHKYDPIPTADYYALAGVFASTDYEEAPLAPEAEVAAYKQGQAAITAKDKEITKYFADEGDRLVRTRAGETARYLVAAWSMGTSDARSVARDQGLDANLLRRWADYLASPDRATRPGLAAWLDVAGLPEATRPEIEAAAAGVQAAVVDLLDRKGKLADPAAKEFYSELFGDSGLLAVPKNQVEKALPPESRERLKALRAELDGLKKSAPPMYPFAHALKDGAPRTMPILARGNPDSPGPEVPRRFLSVLGGTQLGQGSGRLDLARAIASPDNPLTARVLVNRVWLHHFGRGLVGTPSNFGALGERPTHPELLDWLARRFVEGGWSIKQLHRLILLSSTYQQSSRADDRAREADPENRWLGRMGRRRLEVEAWRDALLAVSGRLEPALGGPSFTLDNPAASRRTLYAAVSRHDLSPLLRLFDFPDPNITSGGRTQTTVPLQQLVVLNDELVVRSAKALAARLASESSDDAARIDRAYALLFGRPPTEAERRLGLGYLAAPDIAGDPSDLGRWARYAQALLGSNEFLYVD